MENAPFKMSIDYTGSHRKSLLRVLLRVMLGVLLLLGVSRASVAADQPNMPLRKTMRVVISATNAGDAVTIDKVWVSQEL